MKSLFLKIISWISKRKLVSSDKKGVTVTFKATQPSSSETCTICTIEFPYVADWIKTITQDIADTQGPWVRVDAVVGNCLIATAFGKGYIFDAKGKQIWVERPAFDMSQLRLSGNTLLPSQHPTARLISKAQQIKTQYLSTDPESNGIDQEDAYNFAQEVILLLAKK